MCASGINRQPRGAALIIAMLVMAVLLMAGTTFLTISSTESQIALNERAATQALLLAEAGLHKAIARLNQAPVGSYSGETNRSLGSGNFTLTVATTAGCTATSARSLVATGTVPVAGGQAQVQLQVTVDQISYPFRWGVFAAVPNLVVTDDARREKELWLGESSTSDSFDSAVGGYDATSNRGSLGNIGANGDVTLDRNTVISGSVSAGDAIHKGSDVSISGSETPGAASQSFPSLTSGTTPTGPLEVRSNSTVNLKGGTYYYTNIKFGSNSSLTTSDGPVTIYVTGELDLGNGVTFGANPPTDLRIIAKSDGADTSFVSFKEPTADIGNNFTFYGSFYGKNADIKLGSSAKIYGSMIGRTIKLGNGAAIHYDQALSDKPICAVGSAKYTILRGTWREVYPTS